MGQNAVKLSDIDIAAYKGALRPLIKRRAKVMKEAAERSTFTRDGVEHDGGPTAKANDRKRALGRLEDIIADIIDLAKSDGIEATQLIAADPITRELWVVGDKEKSNAEAS